jgi:hypothetical protein
MANDWILTLGVLMVILLGDILIAAAVIKVCLVLGFCDEPPTLAYHSVDGNSMRSKYDNHLNINPIP